MSTPAVNKWEKGNTYPDISLLPALARLLKIDMNELFSFREELTEKEIGQFVNELSEFHWTALQRLSRWHLVKYRSILIATY
jgi:Helix-turn-helix.